jgi:hypothetical protein
MRRFSPDAAVARMTRPAGESPGRRLPLVALGGVNTKYAIKALKKPLTLPPETGHFVATSWRRTTCGASAERTPIPQTSATGWPCARIAGRKG